MATIKDLPNEIMDLVLSYLRPGCIRALHLTDTSFRTSLERRAYRQIKCDASTSPEKAGYLMRTLLERPILATYVRIIRFVLDTNTKPRPIVGEGKPPAAGQKRKRGHGWTHRKRKQPKLLVEPNALISPDLAQRALIPAMRPYELMLGDRPEITLWRAQMGEVQAAVVVTLLLVEQNLERLLLKEREAPKRFYRKGEIGTLSERLALTAAGYDVKGWNAQAWKSFWSVHDGNPFPVLRELRLTNQPSSRMCLMVLPSLNELETWGSDLGDMHGNYAWAENRPPFSYYKQRLHLVSLKMQLDQTNVGFQDWFVSVLGRVIVLKLLITDQSAWDYLRRCFLQLGNTQMLAGGPRLIELEITVTNDWKIDFYGLDLSMMTNLTSVTMPATALPRNTHPAFYRYPDIRLLPPNFRRFYLTDACWSARRRNMGVMEDDVVLRTLDDINARLVTWGANNPAFSGHRPAAAFPNLDFVHVRVAIRNLQGRDLDTTTRGRIPHLLDLQVRLRACGVEVVWVVSDLEVPHRWLLV